MTDNSSNEKAPLGFTLRYVLRGQDFFVKQMAWSPDGLMLAAPCDNGTIEIWDTVNGMIHRRLRVAPKGAFSVAWMSNDYIVTTSGDGSYKKSMVTAWNPETGEKVKDLIEHSTSISCLTWSPIENTIAAGCNDGTILIRNSISEQITRINALHLGAITNLAWSPDGKALAITSQSSSSKSDSLSISIWDVDNEKIRWSLRGHSNYVNSIAWSPDGQSLASGSSDHTIRLWDIEEGQQTNIIEGHTDSIISVSFTPDGRLLASKSEDNSVRIWRCDTWETVAKLDEISYLSASISYHPTSPVLATIGRGGKSIRIWDFDLNALAVRPVSSAGRYANAKVVLVGDTGVGKSGLGLVLSGQPFAPTDSTHGRRVWTLESQEVHLAGGRVETHETLLWDLAGQPGYRIIHQLHLNEVTVALIVFDARNDIDPLAGVRHWDRALRQARIVQGDTALPIKKFLVAARIDRGGVSISRQRIELLLQNLDFDDYFETSSREGWNIDVLRKAVNEAIEWAALPKVNSTELFKRMKDFLIEEKESGWLLSTTDDLYRAFLKSTKDLANTEELYAQFKTCIGRLESRDLVQRLSFGNLILLQPEMLDSYASAIVNASKEEPDGLGCIAEEVAREGQFRMSQDERIKDKEEERLLLIATVEDLLRHEIALREQTDQGTHLVFPTQLTRENPDLPDPEGKAVIYNFDGPLLSIYATLIVRLSHSGVFKKKEMWKNATTFAARVRGTCGVFLREVEEGRGELALFFDPETSEETRFQFEEYVHTHLLRRAIPESIQRRRIFVCLKCGESITAQQAMRRRERGLKTIDCPVCDSEILLLDREERIIKSLPSIVPEIDRAANAQRELDAGLISAAGEMRTQSFQSWTGSSRTTLAIVFTDIVDSTIMVNEIGNEEMLEILRTHFRQARQLLSRYHGYEIKTIGDSLMIAFRTAAEALDFALALDAKTGHERVRIRAGIHVGPVHIEEEDAFGLMVNYANRVSNMGRGSELWVSNEAKDNIDQEKAKRHSNLIWVQHSDCELKGFPGKRTLWSVKG